MKKADKNLSDYSRHAVDLFAEYISADETRKIIEDFGGNPNAQVTVKLYKETNPQTGRPRWITERRSLLEVLAHRIDNAIVGFCHEKGHQPDSRPPPKMMFETWSAIRRDVFALIKSLHIQSGETAIPWPIAHDWNSENRHLHRGKEFFERLYSDLMLLAATAQNLTGKYEGMVGGKKRHPDTALDELCVRLADIKKELLPGRGTLEDFTFAVLKILKSRDVISNIPTVAAFQQRRKRRRRGTKKAA